MTAQLADDSTVRAVAAGQIDRDARSGESIQLAASRAYDRHADELDSFWDALEAMPAAADRDGQQPDEGSDGHFGGPDDRPGFLSAIAADRPFEVTVSG